MGMCYSDFTSSWICYKKMKIDLKINRRGAGHGE